MNRTRQERWDAGHICTASTRLSRRQYLALREACAVEGTTVYALLLRLIKAWMLDFAADHPEWDSAIRI